MFLFSPQGALAGDRAVTIFVLRSNQMPLLAFLEIWEGFLGWDGYNPLTTGYTRSSFDRDLKFRQIIGRPGRYYRFVSRPPQ